MVITLGVFLIGLFFVLFNSNVQTFIVKRLILHYNTSYGFKISLNKLSISPFKTIEIKDLVLLDLNNDTLLKSDLNASLSNISIKKHTIQIKKIELNKLKTNIIEFNNKTFNYDLYLPTNLSKNKTRWSIVCNDFKIQSKLISFHLKQNSKDSLLFVSTDLNTRGSFTLT